MDFYQGSKQQAVVLRQPGLSFARAFTVVELLVTVACLLVLLSLLLPAFSSAKRRSVRLQCLNNLRQMVIAARTFSGDNDNRLPWYVSPSEGGSMDAANQEAFRHLSCLSNYLKSAPLLSCPADRSRVPATDWNTLSDQRISYFVGYEVTDHNAVGTTMVFGDRNVSGPYNAQGCGAWPGAMGTSISTFTTWVEDLHGRSGHFASIDGSVHYAASDLQLQEAAMASDAKNYNNHARVP